MEKHENKKAVGKSKGQGGQEEGERKRQLEKNTKEGKAVRRRDGWRWRGKNAIGTAMWRRKREKFDTQNEHRVQGTIDHFAETHDLQDNSTIQSKLFDCWQYVARMHGFRVCLLTWYIKHKLDCLSYRSLNASYPCRLRRNVRNNDKISTAW